MLSVYCYTVSYRRRSVAHCIQSQFCHNHLIVAVPLAVRIVAKTRRHSRLYSRENKKRIRKSINLYCLLYNRKVQQWFERFRCGRNNVIDAECRSIASHTANVLEFKNFGFFFVITTCTISNSATSFDFIASFRWIFAKCFLKECQFINRTKKRCTSAWRLSEQSKEIFLNFSIRFQISCAEAIYK